MNDILFLVSTVLCFAVALLYVTACDRLKAKPNHD